MARLRAFGTFASQITDPQLFVNKIVGTQNLTRTADVEKFMRSIVISKMTDLLGEMGKSVLDLPAMIEELGSGIRAKAADEFAARGMNITSCYVESISPTEETAKAIDEAAAMGAIGDMGAYMQFQAARAMRDAAQSEGGGGVAGAGVGLGAGAGMGMAMAQMMSQAMQGGQQPQQAAQQVAQAAEQLTPEQVQAALDNLAVRLANGEISEEIYTKLSAQLEKKLGG
jgi:membrane protease subunit (stomatin/prohibitin family)